MAYFLQFLILFVPIYHLLILINFQYLIIFDYWYRIPIILIIFILSLCHITRLIILECFPNLKLMIHYVMFILEAVSVLIRHHVLFIQESHNPI